MHAFRKLLVVNVGDGDGSRGKSSAEIVWRREANDKGRVGMMNVVIRNLSHAKKFTHFSSRVASPTLTTPVIPSTASN